MLKLGAKRKMKAATPAIEARMDAARRRCENISFILLIPAQE